MKKLFFVLITLAATGAVSQKKDHQEVRFEFSNDGTYEIRINGSEVYDTNVFRLCKLPLISNT